MRVVQNLDSVYWHDFADEAPGASIFHTPEMFEVFARTDGYKPGLWAVVGSDRRPLALFTPVRITLFGGPLSLLTSRAVAYGSVLCQCGDEGQAALSLLLRAYDRQRPGNVIFTELRNVVSMSYLHPALEACGYQYEAHLNFLIDLTRSEAELWSKIRSNARRNIQKAEKMGVMVDEVTNLDQLAPVYSVLKDVYKRLQVPLPNESLFRSSFHVLHPRNMLRILVARLDDLAIGALMLLVHQGVITYWYTGALREFSAYRPSDLLVWRALKLGAESGCRVFDFGGGGRPDVEYGVRDFKAKFGGELVNFGRYLHIHAPRRFRLSQTGYQMVRRLL
jgi:hypothetical protein